MTTKKTKLVILLVILLVFYVGPSHGAVLEHMRIGEHEAFTRIVFEFGGSAPFGQLSTGDSNRIAMAFTEKARHWAVEDKDLENIRPTSEFETIIGSRTKT